ncbi:MAG: hypothetical protein ACYC1K_01785 [Minisyncoccota bacterium]
MTGPVRTRWDDRQVWWKNNRKEVFGWVIIVVILILLIWGAFWVFTPAFGTTKKPIPVSVTQTPAVNEYTHVFNVGPEKSEVWVFPTNTKGWILTWNTDDLTVPYQVITDNGTFACWPGGEEVRIGPTRSIAFRSLSDKTTKIRAMLSRP